MQRDVRAIVDGGIGGLLGTVAMSLLMVAAQKVGLLGGQPPEHITAALLNSIGLRDRGEGLQDAVAAVLHFSFGTGAGALFGLLHRRLRLPLGPAPRGVIFGTLLWAASYKGWLPALGIMPPPERDRPRRAGTMVLAHWVYGGALGLVVGRPGRHLVG